MTNSRVRWVFAGLLVASFAGCQAMHHGGASKTRSEAMDMEPKPRVETSPSPSPFAPFDKP